MFLPAKVYLQIDVRAKKTSVAKFFAMYGSASEQRAKVFCLEEMKFLKTKTTLPKKRLSIVFERNPFNANEQDRTNMNKSNIIGRKV